MTELDTSTLTDLGELPTLIETSAAFIARLPSQRVIDLLARLEPGVKFAELMENQPPRMIAFRVLSRDHPGRDPASLWAHAYDCEVAIVDVDPTSQNGRTTSPRSAVTGG
jgi:hypothetical protein